MRRVRVRQSFILLDPGQQKSPAVRSISAVPNDVIGIPIYQTFQRVGASPDP